MSIKKSKRVTGIHTFKKQKHSLALKGKQRGPQKRYATGSKKQGASQIRQQLVTKQKRLSEKHQQVLQKLQELLREQQELILKQRKLIEEIRRLKQQLLLQKAKGRVKQARH